MPDPMLPHDSNVDRKLIVLLTWMWAQQRSMPHFLELQEWSQACEPESCPLTQKPGQVPGSPTPMTFSQHGFVPINYVTYQLHVTSDHILGAQDKSRKEKTRLLLTNHAKVGPLVFNSQDNIWWLFVVFYPKTKGSFTLSPKVLGIFPVILGKLNSFSCYIISPTEMLECVHASLQITFSNDSWCHMANHLLKVCMQMRNSFMHPLIQILSAFCVQTTCQVL